jgi:hypothetical protein
MRFRLMYAVLLAACPAWSVIVCASEPERSKVTVDFLYESCAAAGQTARGMIPYFDCRSYVYGVLDSYLAIRAGLPAAQRACFPPAITPERVLEIGRGPLAERGSEVAATALIDELRKAYPCKR